MKNNAKIITALVIGIIIGTIGYVVADNVVSIMNANQVGYSNPSKTQKTNVQEAVDELYDMAKTHCPSDYNCHNTKNSRIVPATYGETFKAIVYLDPSNPSQNCTKDNSSVGSEVTGCMKWYAFSETSTTYNLILDHNVGVYTRSNISTAINTLVNSGWALTPRLMTGQDVANIIGNSSWSKTNTNSWTYLDGTKTGTKNSSNPSKYYWLFGFMGIDDEDCIEYGCVTNNSSYPEGAYWLLETACSDDESCSSAWNVDRLGRFMPIDTNTYASRGFRPVITVNKANLGL